jgi:acetylornithine deacetylase/succinyl-diaminopimelate desuccinylase-like protein
MSDATDHFVNENRDRLLEELEEFLRIPSISTLPEHADDVARAAAFVAAKLKGAGLENVEVIATQKHPLVYADWLHAPGKPTVLSYGHFDVQPADPLDLWLTPPFEPTVRQGNIYARGAADDKGQMYSHIKAVEALRSTTGTLPLNLKFLIEGEEEIGGVSISRYVEEHPDKLKADIALVSDTSMYAPGLPTLNVGLRGLVYMEVEATGPSRDLHSGVYGGASPNPVFGLIELLNTVKDSKGKIKVKGFYDDVKPPSSDELESWSKLPFKEKDFLREEVGSLKLTGEKGHTVLERVWSRPTFEVHGIAGGFTGAGSKTVIPSKAMAKVSFRLVPDQNPEQIIAEFRKHVEKKAPKGIKVEVRVLGASPGLMVDTNHPGIRIAAQAMEDVFGKRTVFTRSGGSIPIVGDFAKFIGIPTILMGFGLPDDGLHSPNEKYNLDNYYKGIMTVAHFFEKYGEVSEPTEVETAPAEVKA